MKKVDEKSLPVVRVCQNEIMDEKTLPVVPSSWEEGLGVVEKNNDIGCGPTKGSESLILSPLSLRKRQSRARDGGRDYEKTPILQYYCLILTIFSE